MIKKCETCGQDERFHEEDDNGQKVCDTNDIRRHAANVKRRAKNRERYAATRDAMDSIGMKRVRGSMGGTYWE